MSRSNHSQPKFPEGSTNLHSSHETDGDPGPHNPGIRGPKRRSTVPPDGGNSPGTPGLHSSSIDTSNSQSSAMGWNNINPEPIQYDNTSEYRVPFCSTDIPRVNSPTQLTTASLGPAPLTRHGDSPTRATGRATDSNGDYFDFSPDYLQYPASREQRQPARGPQDQVFYRNPNPNINDFDTCLPPYQPTQHDAEPPSAINRPSIDSYICSTCGIKCKRQTDLDRHLKTARSHGAPRGPACPERGCKYTARFTRVDNFIVHYKKQHGKTDEEVHIFLQEWKA